VKQILLNLIINAVKFTDKGNITCVVDVEEKHDSTVLLRFDVSDTGIGLNPEDIENIFAPFIQVDTSNTRKKGGAGLGLTVCNQLVSLMEGDIRVDTEVNAGSTFHVRIPFVVNDATPSTYNVRHVDQSQLWVDMPLHVLLVEDNETSRQLFTQMLKKHGHSVDVAENGAMALERWRQTNYDIVLMDVQMPVMDGIVATEKIREMERGGDTKTPIIALTAHAMKKDRSKMTTKGFDGYLTKPTRIKDLFNEMKQCLLKSSHQDHL
jgi:CheY-like chemotaxis protein